MTKVLLFKTGFSPKNIKQLNNLIENNYDYVPSNKDGAKSKDGLLLKDVSVYQIYWHKVKSILNEIYQDVEYRITHNFGYNIFPINDFSYLNLNIYKNNNSYNWHVDAADGNASWDMKGTVLINLSTKPYKGGQFKYFFNGEEVAVDHLDVPGNMIFLPPWTYHKVDPVSEGERRTLAIFVRGTKWQ
jgi:hypothetical protein